MAIGGMIQRRDEKKENKVPWLGDLPYIGTAFRYRTQAKTKTELLVILTPHIVRSRAEADRVLAEESRRMDYILERRGADAGSVRYGAGVAPERLRASSRAEAAWTAICRRRVIQPPHAGRTHLLGTPPPLFAAGNAAAAARGPAGRCARSGGSRAGWPLRRSARRRRPWDACRSSSPSPVSAADASRPLKPNKEPERWRFFRISEPRKKLAPYRYGAPVVAAMLVLTCGCVGIDSYSLATRRRRPLVRRARWWRRGSRRFTPRKTRPTAAPIRRRWSADLPVWAGD